MTDTDKPRFMLRLGLSRLTDHVDIEDPTLISEEVLDQAWHMVSDFVIDTLDDLGEEVTDEEYRARFLEVCYRLIYREMFTLHVMPRWEKSDMERLGTPKRGPRTPKKGSYGYSEW